MSGAINKVKDALSNKDHTTTTSTTRTTHGNTHNTTGVPEGTAGPHSSRVANAADPRVDSDLDSSRNAGIGHTGHTTGGYTGTTTGVAGTGVGHTGHTTSTNAGPHNSNLLNKADPRVDSDLDGSRNLGASTGTGYGTAGTAHTTHGTTGLTGTHGTTGTHAGTHGTTGVTGTHNTTGLTGTHGTTGTHTGTHGYTGDQGGLSRSTNAGPHDSNVANKLDPRVDSDLDGRGNRHGAATGGVFGASGSHATPGSGTAQNTAGPHNSDLANKLDPRVDSDRDGSKTVGGNKTHA